MSGTASPSSTHADLRGTSRSYKRDKNHTSKWSLGSRPNSNEPVLDSAWTPDAPSTTMKAVPLKKHVGAPKASTNVSTKARGISHFSMPAANLRVTRKQDAFREIKSPDSKNLSRSLADLLPSTSTSIPIRKNDAPDAGILYSFDKKASPSDTVGLGSLIEKAEQRFKEKETVKLVKNEYEILDGEGEREVLRKGGRLEKDKGASARGGGLELDDEDDYELV